MKIYLDSENFPDANFRKALSSKLGISEGDEITEEMFVATTLLNVSSCRIADLTGIEYFTALTRLYCHNNQLTSLDVSKNTALQDLECNNNQLTKLDVTNNTALTSLECYGNQLTSLDVSQNTVLGELYCGGNQLTALDVSQNTALTELYCHNNRLTALDVTENQQLRMLSINKDVELYFSPNLQKELVVNRISYENILE